MTTRKSPPEKIGLTPVATLAKDLLSADPDSSGPAQQTGSHPPATYAKGTEAEQPPPNVGGEAQARAAAFNEETRREEEAKALNKEIDDLHKRIKGHEEKALALSLEELTQGIDLALENMSAGLTQSEAVRRAAETIRSEKVASQKLDPSG